MRKTIYTIAVLLITLQLKSQTVKKVLMEEFSGTWCGGCPNATLVAEAILADNPGVCIPVCWHYNDPLTIPELFTIQDFLKVEFYPVGAVDRLKYPGNDNIAFTKNYWEGTFNTHKTTAAKASISFEDAYFDGTSYHAKVNVVFLAPPEPGVPVRLNVYITQDSIAAVGTLEQDNYDTNIEGGASPLTNWFHNATMRKALGGAWGFNTIPVNPLPGTVYTETISFIPATDWVTQHMNVIAYVAYDGDTALNQKEVLNSEQLRLSAWSPLAINTPADGALQTLIYPDPARTNSILKIAFHLKQDARVSVAVVNSIGLVVGSSYQSYEIAGSHTIQWPVTTAMTAGRYFVRLVTDKGDAQVSGFTIE